MNIAEIHSFLMWATLLNVAILLLGTAAIARFGKPAAAIQSKLFHISEEQFFSGTFIVLGVYKMMILVFLFVPWIVLYLIPAQATP
ncbi:hypothetical protein DV096_18510 [Bradymonadaceae bacterium TMQ3]|nr:hypothetical protein DV096_18510 [Bradymonadaceae bacterium TMQ3]TXC74501.1 hypothetical protein FRC91_15410 [Bradymonadales bacterium TMQ1]